MRTAFDRPARRRSFPASQTSRSVVSSLRLPLVRGDDGAPPVEGEIGPLRIDGDEDPLPVRRRGDFLDQLFGQRPLPVIGKDDAVDPGEGGQRLPQQRVGRLSGRRGLLLAVDANDLLAVGDHPRLDGGGTLRVHDHSGGADPFPPEHPGDEPAPGVVAEQTGHLDPRSQPA